MSLMRKQIMSTSSYEHGQKLNQNFWNCHCDYGKEFDRNARDGTTHPRFMLYCPFCHQHASEEVASPFAPSVVAAHNDGALSIDMVLTKLANTWVYFPWEHISASPSEYHKLPLPVVRGIAAKRVDHIWMFTPRGIHVTYKNLPS